MGRVIFIGNMGSGKTTIAQMLKEQRGLSYFAIDDFRRKYNKGRTIKGESKARKKFFEAIKSNPNCIVELTGTGGIYKEVWSNALDVENDMVIKLYAPKSVLKIRYRAKKEAGYDWPPLPSSWDMDSSEEAIYTGIEWMEKQLHSVKANMNIDTHKMTPKQIMKIIHQAK